MYNVDNWEFSQIECHYDSITDRPFAFLYYIYIYIKIAQTSYLDSLSSIIFYRIDYKMLFHKTTVNL